MKITVIMRDETPIIFLQEPCRYRSVQIELTPEQEAKIKPRQVGIRNGKPILEVYSNCFIENEVTE